MIHLPFIIFNEHGEALFIYKDHVKIHHFSYGKLLPRVRSRLVFRHWLFGIQYKGYLIREIDELIDRRIKNGF